VGRLLLQRIGYGLVALWGVVTLVFLLFNVLPADPARLTMGQRSDLSTLTNIRHEMNLDKPMPIRYLMYLNDLSPISVHATTPAEQNKYHYTPLMKIWGKQCIAAKWPYLGRSYRTKREVAVVLGEALPGTIILALTAMAFATIIGILLGVIAATNKNTLLDTGSIAISVAGISMPSFFAGLLVAYGLGYVLHTTTGLNMTGSLYEYDPINGKHLVLRNLILPALALGIRPLAIITQLTRSAMLDTLSQDYIRTAYAKGLPTYKIIWKHALPNALNPVITAITGWLAELLAGSFFIEYIFGWKGVGKITVDALDKFDFPLVMGSVLLSAVIFICMNIITDMIYKWIDPRVQL
jgi:peptide/nickel transport system permease protein